MYLFVKDTVLNIIFAVAFICATEKLLVISADSLFGWGIYAVIISVFIIIAIVLFNMIINYKSIAAVIKKIKNKTG